MGQTQELVSIVPWTFIAQICNLFIQLGLMKRFLFGPICGIIEERKALADRQLSEAREAMQTAQALEKSNREEFKAARGKAQEIVQSALREAAGQSEAVISEAKSQAASIRARAEADIDAERSRAALQLKQEIGSMAVELAEKIIGREIKTRDHKRMIEEFVRHAGEAS